MPMPPVRAAAQTSPPFAYCRSAGIAIGFRATTTETLGRACPQASPCPTPCGRCTSGLISSLGRPLGPRRTAPRPASRAKVRRQWSLPMRTNGVHCRPRCQGRARLVRSAIAPYDCGVYRARAEGVRSVVIAARIHPGIAVLVVVAGLTAALLILQGVNHKSTATTPAPSTPTDQSLPSAARTPTAQPLSGIARVIDGDTIDVHGTHIRLNGIDAPESKQTCEATGQTYACGEQATEALIVLLGARPVECTERGKDRYQRIIATCHIDSTDLGAWMVEHGWAVAYRKYSLDYAGAEDRARSAKLGIWAGTFDMPEDWRRRKAIQGMERAMEKSHVQQ